MSRWSNGGGPSGYNKHYEPPEITMVRVTFDVTTHLLQLVKESMCPRATPAARARRNPTIGAVAPPQAQPDLDLAPCWRRKHRKKTGQVVLL